MSRWDRAGGMPGGNIWIRCCGAAIWTDKEREVGVQSLLIGNGEWFPNRNTVPDRERGGWPLERRVAAETPGRCEAAGSGGWPHAPRGDGGTAGEVRGCRKWWMAARATGRWRNRRGGARLPEVADGRASHGEMARATRNWREPPGRWPRRPPEGPPGPVTGARGRSPTARGGRPPRPAQTGRVSAGAASPRYSAPPRKARSADASAITSILSPSSRRRSGSAILRMR